MRENLGKMLRTVGEAAIAVQDRRQQRMKWRVQAWKEPIQEAGLAWEEITGEIPRIQPTGR